MQCKCYVNSCQTIVYWIITRKINGRHIQCGHLKKAFLVHGWLNLQIKDTSHRKGLGRTF